MPDLRAFLDGGGEMAERIRAFDWAATAMGPIHAWPQSVRSVLSICLRSATATALFWGPDHLFLYNDAWAAYLGERHPHVLGMPAAEAMIDIWPALEDQVRAAYDRGETINMVDALLVRERSHGRVESWWSYSLLPAASEDGTIGGIIAQARERTDAVLNARRDAVILTLEERLRTAHTPAAVLAAALSLLGKELGANRVGYGEIADDDRFTIHECWTDGTVSDIRGEYGEGYFNPRVAAALQRGEAVAIADGEAEVPELGEDVVARWRRVGCRASLVVPLVSDGRHKAVLFAHHATRHVWTGYEKALLRAFIERIRQDLARARAEAALRHSERRYRQIFEGANDLIFTADLNRRLTDCNPAVAAAMGITPEEAIGRPIREFVSDESWKQTERMLRTKLNHGGTTRHDIAVVAPDGRRMFWEVNSSLAFDSEGRVVGLHAIGRDVTERRRFEQRQRLLVNELNHRVKNTLALVQGLALQSFKDGRAMAEAREAFQHRLAALAAAHDLLTQESWEGATLSKLVEDATGHHGEDGRISARGPDLKLNPRSAVSLVMALHELCTNAAKYGALSVPEGRVEIAWEVDENSTLRMSWSERGGPPVRPTGRRGFGFRMIERALAADLEGAVKIEMGESGLTCRIEAPFSG